MKEIKRIIEKNAFYRGEDFAYTIDDEHRKQLAKAIEKYIKETTFATVEQIEQYVLKARIEVLDKFAKKHLQEDDVWFYYNKAMEEIAELKKGLKK